MVIARGICRVPTFTRLAFIIPVVASIVCFFCGLASDPALAGSSELQSPPQLAFVFSVNMASTKESQKYPFRDKLYYNYSPNPDLRFIEGKNFSDEEARQLVSQFLESSKIQRITRNEWFSLSEKVWLNTPASQVMAEAKQHNIHTLFFVDIQSWALVQSINQQKTLFLYNKDKPEKTTIYDYFYNVRGQLALINVEHDAVLYQKTLTGIDFNSPRDTKIQSKDELFSKTVRALGDVIFDIIRGQKDTVLTWKPESPDH